MTKPLYLAIVLPAIFAAMPATAKILTFDDQPTGFLTNYGGIDFSVGDWWNYGDTQLDYVPHSGKFRIYAIQDLPEWRFASPVKFTGAWFSGNFTLAYDLYLGGVLQASSDTISLIAPPIFLGNSYSGLTDRVVLRPQIANGYFVADDITFLTPGVPEPASWAMMIGGCALAGAAMRRRTLRLRFA